MNAIFNFIYGVILQGYLLLNIASVITAPSNFLPTFSAEIMCDESFVYAQTKFVVISVICIRETVTWLTSSSWGLHFLLSIEMCRGVKELQLSRIVFIGKSN